MAMIVGDANAGTGMANAIYVALKSATGAGTVDGPALKAFANALAQGIVPYIQSTAVVVGTATGVTAGAATAPVAGTVG